MINIILHLWQLPQHIIALIFRLIQRNNIVEMYKKDISSFTKLNTAVYILENFNSGVSFGKYIFVAKNSTNLNLIIYHEKGHSIQSKYLGWLYLIIIGIPSALHHMWYFYKKKGKSTEYYDFWTEKWANNLITAKKENMDYE